MESTCRPSIFGMFRSTIINVKPSDSSSDRAREPEEAVRTSGRHDKCWLSISLYKIKKILIVIEQQNLLLRGHDGRVF